MRLCVDITFFLDNVFIQEGEITCLGHGVSEKILNSFGFALTSLCDWS